MASFVVIIETAREVTGVANSKVQKKNSSGRRQFKKNFILLTMVLPTAIWLILLRYLPMFGITIAFKDYKIYTKAPGLINNIIHSKWVGFDNFKFLFATTDSLKMIRNTVGYNLLWIFLGLVISVSFAIILNEITNKFVAKTYQTLMFFPYFISWVVVSYFVMALLDPTNGLIVKWQIKNFGEATNWYHTSQPWPIILTLANLWKNTGYSCILYLTAITGIDKTLYEAASIDGATRWQQVRFVTLPNLRTMIAILLIMNISKIFNSDFGLFWNVPLASGSILDVTQTIDTYVYRSLAATGGNLGMTTAAGVFQNVVGFCCMLAANSIVKRIDADSSLF